MATQSVRERAERVGRGAIAQPRRNPMLAIFAALVFVGVIAAAYLYAVAPLSQRAAEESSPNEEVPALVGAQQTPTVEPTAVPTRIPTQEPTSTLAEPIVESPRTDVQEWWQMVVVEAEKHGCTPTFQLVNVRETGMDNAIPWTSDQNGETVQGIIPVFCGTGAYLAFGDLSTSVSPDYVEKVRGGVAVVFPTVIGPTHVLRQYVGLELTDKFLGGLSAEGIAVLREFHLCLGGDLDNWPFIATLVVEVDPELGYELTGGYLEFSQARWQQCVQ